MIISIKFVNLGDNYPKQRRKMFESFNLESNVHPKLKDVENTYHSKSFNNDELESNYNLDDIVGTALEPHNDARIGCDKELRKLLEIRRALDWDIKEIDEELVAVNKTISKIRDGPLSSYDKSLANSVNDSKETFSNTIKYFEVMKAHLNDNRRQREKLKAKCLSKKIQLYEIEEKISTLKRAKENDKTESLSGNYQTMIKTRKW